MPLLWSVSNLPKHIKIQPIPIKPIHFTEYPLCNSNNLTANGLDSPLPIPNKTAAVGGAMYMCSI